MLENHLLLEGEIRTFAGFLGPEIHCVGDADIGVGEAHRVEVSALIGGLPARLRAIEQTGKVAVHVGVRQFSVLVHPA
mgnify:CR=1 FL=1